ncbi:cupredoxin domain-containing protein [Labrys neptuniae]
MLRPLRRRSFRRLAFQLALLSLPVLSGWYCPARAASAQARVTIDNFTFSPAELTVPPGTTVIWVNRDDIPHTVTETNKVFRSKALDTDDNFSFTFNKSGDFSYFCSLHPHMTGRIVVKETTN